MSGRLQELMIVFDREQQTVQPYLGLPWEPLGEEIKAAQRAVETAGVAHGLRLDGPDEIKKPIAGPHAVLLFRWGYPGTIDTFLSEEPLTPVEQAIVAATIAAAPGWFTGAQWQGNTRLPLLEGEAPQPFSMYRLLPAVACPARHPAVVLAVWRCLHCDEAVTRFGVFPTRCAVCGSDRGQAFQIMERQGYICPICLPMQQDRIGQPREVCARPADASST